MTQEVFEAITALRNAAFLGTDEDREKMQRAVEVVAKALSAEPRTGHWIDVPNYPWCFGECSECHRVRIRDKHCANCGAKMEANDEA